MDFQKIKYQGIKITTNPTSRSSYGNNIVRNNTDRDHAPSYNPPPANNYMASNSYMINSVGVTPQVNNIRREG